MEAQEVYEMLKEIGLPLAYHHFEEGQSPSPPFAVYLFKGTENVPGDGGAYIKINNLDVELYTDKKDLEAEDKVEKVLDAKGIFYQKNDSYIETEDMYEVLYEMEI